MLNKIKNFILNYYFKNILIIFFIGLLFRVLSNYFFNLKISNYDNISILYYSLTPVFIYILENFKFSSIISFDDLKKILNIKNFNLFYLFQFLTIQSKSLFYDFLPKHYANIYINNVCRINFFTNNDLNVSYLNKDQYKFNLFDKYKRELYWILIEKHNKSSLDSIEVRRYDMFVKNWNPDTKLLKSFISNELHKYKVRINTLKWVYNRRNPK